MNKIKLAIQLLKNMGFRYVLFRAGYLISSETGLFKKKFPVNPPVIDVISLNEWKNNLPPFFFYGKNIPGLKNQRSDRLTETFNDITSGTYTFFGKSKFYLGTDYNWITNPVNNYKYDISQHWSLIKDLSEKNGDIKFVWEKARFSFLHDLIRYDHHFGKDCAEIVFGEILSFIDNNPVNQGPNYICSQEISLRILNWTFALYYYKDSEYLTEKLFRKIMNAIYWQIHHVYHNINFSRIAVRNNHAITETLLLYLSNLLFPYLPDVKKWSNKGKKWFSQEIGYQIYDDGTYLQFSNNYHRVVVQLLTLGIRLAELNNDKLDPEVYGKAEKSLEFLFNSMDITSGFLPNYGANDGALFFKFNDQDFRDYRPQLQALSYVLGPQEVIDLKEFKGEDLYWLGYSERAGLKAKKRQDEGVFSYPDGGFYIMRDKDSMSFIRCGKHKDRPGQADNLHLDIWYNGTNVFRDNGSYMYNTEKELSRYFVGTRSHNTLMLDEFDQMLKGPRFIWLNWSQAEKISIKNSEFSFEFEGTISAFRYLNKNIKHRRTIIKTKGIAKWEITDEITGTLKYELNQIWHPDPDAMNSISITAHDSGGRLISKQIGKGWYSSYYGQKEETDYWIFPTNSRKIITTIEIKE